MKTVVSILVAIILFSPNARAQTFTKITDPANPVVNDQFESGGGSWGDFNNDGYPDLFVANGNQTNQSNSIYLNNRSGSFIKIVTGPIVTDGGSSIGGTWGDFDNDGKLDLFVTNRAPASGPLFGNFFYRGNGDSNFTRITAGSPATDKSNSNSSTWVDINNDGYLDLFVINFQADNYRYMNNGPPDFTFTRIDTGAIVQDGGNFSINGVWADYNNDRRPDLFIGNAGNQNNLLFTNNGSGGFTQTTLNDGRSSLGASWGDFDNDGNLDLFVANYLGQNNMLYRNSGPPSYVLTRIDTGIVSNDGGNSVGSVWGDFDNDGDLDLFVDNDNGENNALYLNSGPPDYSFAKVTTGVVVSDGGNSFGCSAADYDNDGDLDIFVANRLNQKNFLYANNGSGNSWVNIKCVGVISNRAGIGTKVHVKATIGGVSRWQMQEVPGQTGYNSQNLTLHFGFGNATVIDSVKIDWPSGITEVFTNQSLNRAISFTEGSGPTSVAPQSQLSPLEFKLEQNYPNPFNPSTIIEYQLPNDEVVTLKIYDVLGRDVATLVDGWVEAGEHMVSFGQTSGLTSGVYFSRLTAGKFSATKQMLLLK